LDAETSLPRGKQYASAASWWLDARDFETVALL